MDESNELLAPFNWSRGIGLVLGGAFGIVMVTAVLVMAAVMMSGADVGVVALVQPLGLFAGAFLSCWLAGRLAQRRPAAHVAWIVGLVSLALMWDVIKALSHAPGAAVVHLIGIAALLAGGSLGGLLATAMRRRRAPAG